MVYEIVDNCVDEALAGYCTEIKKVAIEPGNIISVEDNGRGIPVEIHPKTHISTAETVYTVFYMQEENLEEIVDIKYLVVYME